GHDRLQQRRSRACLGPHARYVQEGARLTHRPYEGGDRTRSPPLRSPPGMPKRTQLIAPKVYDYVLRASSREPDVLERLRKATASVPHNEMQIGADQGQLLAFLVKLIGARRCIDIGTYTGYSALAVALALPPNGLLDACDISAASGNAGRP